MGSSMALSHLTLGDLEGPGSRSLRFQCLISRKRAELGLILVLTINSKPDVGSPMAASDVTLNDIQRSKLKVTMISNSSFS